MGGDIEQTFRDRGFTCGVGRWGQIEGPDVLPKNYLRKPIIIP